MTGPEHYRKGEAWLAMTRAAVDSPAARTPEVAVFVALAQAHFTAALAAATALADGAQPHEDADQWYAAAGTHAARERRISEARSQRGSDD